MQTAVPETVGLSSSRLARIPDAMRRYIDQGAIPGVSTLVYRQGKVAWFHCQGKPAFDADAVLAPDAIFRIYSMTKPITAVAALMLWERGLFGLNEPISTYIPSFADPQVLVEVVDGTAVTQPAKREITIHDLFCHTSGLVYGFEAGDLAQVYHDAGLDEMHMQKTVPTGEMIDALAALPLLYSPGDSWHYGLSQDVLGRLIEVVSGKPFGEYLKEQILEPLGMEDTDFWVPEDKLGRLTTLNAPDEGGTIIGVDSPENTRLSIPPKFESGGGGLVSTMADYMTFARLLLGQGSVDGVRLLGRKTVALMASNHLTAQQHEAFLGSNSPGTGYGLGVSVTLDAAHTRETGSVGDFGWGGAASTRFRVDPAEDMIWLIMTQLIGNPGYDFQGRFQTLAHSALI